MGQDLFKLSVVRLRNKLKSNIGDLLLIDDKGLHLMDQSTGSVSTIHKIDDYYKIFLVEKLLKMYGGPFSDSGTHVLDVDTKLIGYIDGILRKRGNIYEGYPDDVAPLDNLGMPDKGWRAEYAFLSNSRAGRVERVR